MSHRIPTPRKLLLPLVLFTLVLPWGIAVAQPAFPVIELRAGAHLIKAEVAATLEARDVGLMNRRSLPADRGMLFVFPEAHRHCMWMRNTHIPLSVAFLDDTGVIVNIADMQPDTLAEHCAARPVRYALEMNRGWFQRKGLGPGSRVRGIEKSPQGPQSGR